VISEQQATALRRRVIAAFATAGAREPTITEAAVVWDPSDLPADQPVAIRLAVGDEGTPDGVEPEVQHAAGGGGLVETTREILEVPFAVTIHSRASSTAPHFHARAGYLARRVLLHFATPTATQILERVGCGVKRRGRVLDLTSLLRRSQWTSAARIEFVLALQALQSTPVDWIETAAGDGTVTDEGGQDLAVIPWTTE
jgi:hypothetical protein